MSHISCEQRQFQLLENLPDPVFLLQRLNRLPEHTPVLLKHRAATSEIASGDVGARHFQLVYGNNLVDKVFCQKVSGRPLEDLARSTLLNTKVK